MPKKNFSSAVESDAVQMNNFSSLIEQYCAALETIISRYETTEANNASTVAKTYILKGREENGYQPESITGRIGSKSN